MLMAVLLASRRLGTQDDDDAKWGRRKKTRFMGQPAGGEEELRISTIPPSPYRKGMVGVQRRN